MKRFYATLTINLDFEAESYEEAKKVLQEMEYSFDRMPDRKEMDSEIIDEEIHDIT